MKHRYSLIVLLLAMAMVVIPTFAQDGLADVPRERTLILDCVEGGTCAGQISDFGSFNPYIPGSPTRTGFQFMLEPLYFYNAYAQDSSESIIPWIAESHEYNDDFTEVTINIRDGVKWSDGMPWTANDLVFTINMLKDNAPELSFSVDMDNWVAEAVATDDLTAVITLNNPNPRFVFSFFTHNFDNGVPIVPAHIWEGEDPTTFTFLTEDFSQPVVTGPYSMVLSSPQQRIWDLRTDWWASEIGHSDLPQVERVIFLPWFDDIKRTQSMISGEVDTTGDLRPSNMTAVLNATDHVTTFSGRDLPYGYLDWWPTSLGFNVLEEPFNDPDIRWAINYAIDRDQIITIGLQGAGEATLLPFPNFTSLGEFNAGIQALVDASEIAVHDPARTEEIMMSKGWELNGEGFWEKDGEQLSFTIDIFGIFQDFTPILVQQLRNAGFDVTFRMQSDSFSRMSTGEAPAFLFGNGGSVRDPWKTLNNYTSRFVVPTGTGSSGAFWRWANEDFSAIVDQMGTLPADDPQLQELYHDAMTIWLEELPAIPIQQWLHRIPTSEIYWTNWPSLDNPYINTAPWHRTFLLVLLGLEPVQ